MFKAEPARFLATLCLLLLNGVAIADTQSISVPDTGWKLWLDKKANWKAEPTFYPGEASLSTIPICPPTSGWQSLERSDAVVTLPTTVEEHFWGINGLRPYENEYFYEGVDKAPKNGNYLGVSWWSHGLEVPKSFAGKTVILHIRAAKQRAEVYVNQQLVGYQFIAETSFDCDVSNAIRPGQTNNIAIRITNPGGRLDWGDWSFTTLDGKGFFAGHAFGGLDRGITLTAHGAQRIVDAWVLNTPDPRTIFPHVKLARLDGKPLPKSINLAVVELKSHKIVTRGNIALNGLGEGQGLWSEKLKIPDAKLWSPAHPNLYELRISTEGGETKNITFGCRWFGPEGVGTHAILRLNGERIRVLSAISWGFWGMNGLWPTPALAEKEVRVAKSFGLNSLNFHRNIPRTEALDAADRIGLLRYAEPGGGMTLFWNKTATEDYTQRYMEAKILAMVRDHRSHPSLTMYVIQNELDDDIYKLPLAEKMLRAIHAEDPSRPAVLKSGLSNRGEMWMAPYDDKVYTEDSEGFSGWFDNHTVGTPDSWTDSNYKSPTDYVYRNTDRKEIVDYGEMGGSGAADNHALMLKQIAKTGGKSYDKIDHQEIDSAYKKFLDNYGFRTAFPTNESLYEAVGEKQLDYWRDVIQCARLSDANDYLTISGWETTAIENHSGLVDALRNPHAAPSILASALRPVIPAIQIRKSAVEIGGTVTFDLFFLNETNVQARGKLTVVLRSPNGTLKQLGTYELPKFEKDQFSYLVASDLVTPPLTEVGDYHLQFSLGSVSESQVIHVVALPKLSDKTIALVGSNTALEADLKKVGAHYESYHPAKTYPMLVCAAEPPGSDYSADHLATETKDPELYKIQRFGKKGDFLLRFGNLPSGPVKITLGFAEPYFSSVGNRVFDIEVNGSTVLTNIDLFDRAGGRDKVWTTTIESETKNGQITIGPGQTKKDNASFNTIRIEAGGKTFSYYFGNKPYTAKDGTVWLPYKPFVGLDASVIEKVRQGASLLVISTDDDATTQFAMGLANAGAFKFDGLVGRLFAPWMGTWYFVRKHPLYDGLPTDTVMKGEYQVSVGASNGVVVSGPNVEIPVGYSKDHSRLIGAGEVVTKIGKGMVILHTIPRMIDPFQLRWLSNAINLTIIK